MIICLILNMFPQVEHTELCQRRQDPDMILQVGTPVRQVEVGLHQVRAIQRIICMLIGQNRKQALLRIQMIL